MTNHVYLLVTSETRDGICKSCVVDADHNLLTCQRYIELNPVRANMVNHPGDYLWSSYHANAYGRTSAHIQRHEAYIRLANEEKERRKTYRVLFSSDLGPIELDEIRKACQTGTPLGDNRFKSEIEKTHKTSVGYNRRGRPEVQKGL